MDFLFQLLKNNKIVEAFSNNESSFVVDEEGSSILIASAYLKKKQAYTIVASNLYSAQKIYDSLSNYIGEENCLFFPVDEMLRVEAVSASKEMLAQRLFVMNEALNDNQKVIITHISSLTRFLPSPTLFKDYSLNFNKGGTYSLKEVELSLIKMGYHRVNKIDHSFQFAIRGDILDIYSVNSEKPIRIEFFDDEIESIRYFDIATQESIALIDKVSILPATDIIFTSVEKEQIEQKLTKCLLESQKGLRLEAKERLSIKITKVINDLKNNDVSPTLYQYYGMLQNEHFSILDYAKNNTIVVVNYEKCLDTISMLQEEEANYFLEIQNEGELVKGIINYHDFHALLMRPIHIIKISSFLNGQSDLQFKIRSIVGDFSYQNARSLIESYYNTNKKIIIALSTRQQLTAIAELLKDMEYEYEEISDHLPKCKIGLLVENIETGFELIEEKIAVLSSHELFGYHNRVSRFLSRYKEATIIKSFEELNPGDYVVHEENGIGQFLGIKTLVVDNVHRDYLHIQYAGKDVLYVPLEHFKLVRKYSCKEGARPKINRLGSTEWEKTKRKIRDRVNDIAEGLIQLYAERSSISGFAFNEDDELQRTFENQFPYELTKDQVRSLIEIKEDMEKPKPMDRLLCGDVGFGKTEIAFRAAFKAILSGKQVAILCPTTLLARQHYERALERFGPFGIKIAILSRLVPYKKQQEYISKIANGDVHLIIGTHRLLSKNVKFFDLGLLVVDEEQRFGVRQKEVIKKMKQNVDVLTLTATPIPRTLQMSLLGIRQVSQLNTAPINRMPIQTYVIPQKESVVRELIERELARKGQVFYLHNHVNTIYSRAQKIQNMIPNAHVAVVHGQMEKDDIEDVMMQFYRGEIDVLVCTSIIEIGIDIANANMMIIEGADHFGLSQLYQIKGRVGRGSRVAYAYLMFKPEKELTEDAEKRLKAIQEFTELGSGYRIAQRDLMIRGAGDILGAEQAGFIDTVGIDMYMKLLNEAMHNKKPETNLFEEVKPSKTLMIDAYIPDEYATLGDKIVLYQEIDSVSSIEELDKLEKKTRDIYGKIPLEVMRLFLKKKVDMYLETDYFEDYNEDKQCVSLTISAHYSLINGIGMKLFRGLSDYLSTIKVSFNDKRIVIVFYKKGEWIEKFVHFLPRVMEILSPYHE